VTTVRSFGIQNRSAVMIVVVSGCTGRIMKIDVKKLISSILEYFKFELLKKKLEVNFKFETDGSASGN